MISPLILNGMKDALLALPGYFVGSRFNYIPLEMPSVLRHISDRFDIEKNDSHGKEEKNREKKRSRPLLCLTHASEINPKGFGGQKVKRSSLVDTH